MNADDTSQEESTGTDDKASRSSGKPAASNRILLVPYPKFIFMYPTFIVASIAALVLSFGGYDQINPAESNLPVIVTGVFLVVTLLNMFIIVFDFPRATSLTLVFIVTTIALGAWMWSRSRPDTVATTTSSPDTVATSTSSFLMAIQPAANAAFYWCISGGMSLLFIAVFISVRFDYWELRNNELLHHHGFLSDLKRYPAPNLRVDKEIGDVFEYMLLGAGRLILHPTSEKRAIVLNNVLFVGSKERALTRVLGSIKVQISSDSGPR